ncbi:MAG: glycerophosphodiester phosphodiesterase family protein [Pseudomonadota bacterium]|nr:glycerophosphodiester phosphodiesterase family protein [Pseudomonadota bacterium]
MRFLDIFEKPGLIAAHRGDRSRCPENTLSALRSSLGRCDFAEVDIQLSRDGVPVIIHDKTLVRTSNVLQLPQFAGRAPWSVGDFTLTELQSLDYGSWFYINDPFGTLKDHKVSLPKTTYEPLLTLENALQFAQTHSLFLDIEIKAMPKYVSDATVVESVVGLIRKQKMEALVLISSDYHSYLRYCKTLAPEIATAAIEEHRHPDNLITYLKMLKVDAYHPCNTIVDEAPLEALKAAGIFVNVFTVNEIQRRDSLFAKSVNGVFTDYLNKLSTCAE